MSTGSKQLALGLLLGVVVSCEDRPVQAVRVERVTPQDGLEGGRRVLLNEPLTAYFSEPVSPSLGTEAVRVIDGEGNVVPGDLTVRRRSVTWTPRVPLRADFQDGSLRPNGEYRFEIVGFPNPTGVRGQDGRLIERGRSLSFRTVGRDPEGYPSPLLPVSLEPFEVVRPSEILPMFLAERRLRLAFTLPVLPSSATTDALQVFEIGSDVPKRIAGVELRSRPVPVDPYPGCLLEILLATNQGIEPGDVLGVKVAPGAQLLDYLGRPLVAAADDWLPVIWKAVPGDRVVAELPGGEGEHYRGVDGPGFEVLGGRIRPQVRVETGDGSLGPFRPSADITLRPGEAFDRGDGVMVVSQGGAFPFSSVHIPAGVTVTVSSVMAVQFLCQGDCAVEGELVLGTPLLEQAPLRGATAPIAALCDRAGCALLVGGRLGVQGVVRHLGSSTETRRPVILAAVGAIALDGELPPFSLLSGPLQDGSAESVQWCRAEWSLGVSAPLAVEGWTDWLEIPFDQVEEIEVRLQDLKGVLDVGYQVRLPDAITGGAPTQTGAEYPPTGVRDGDRIGRIPGRFVRFRLRAELQPGQPLPSLGAIQLVGR